MQIISSKENELVKHIKKLKDNELIQIYPSAMEAKRKGYILSSVLECCKSKLKHHKGYKWMFLSDYEAQFNKSKNS